MKKTVLMMAAALSLMMASCGNKQAEQTPEKSKEAKETDKAKKKRKAPKKQAQVKSSAIHDIESEWISNDIDVDSGDITADIETFDTITAIVHRIPRKFLFFRFGTKEIRQEVVCANPHTRITTNTKVDIVK